MPATDDRLLQAIKAATYEESGRTKLACAKAFRLAEQFDTTLGAIGRICDDNSIRIAKCQLGCFD